MRQDPLFYDSAMHAVECAITASGRPFKEVAAHIWPTKKPDTAYARLKSCLNDDKDEKLSFEEIIEICRFCNRFDPLFFFADECSHSRPEPRAPEDEKAELQREFLNGLKKLEVLGARLEKLGGKA